MDQTDQAEKLLKEDADIVRNRGLRKVVAFASPPVFVIVGWMLGAALSWWFGLPAFIGGGAGIFVGTFASIFAWNKSTIKNDVTTGFMTIDPFASLFPNLANRLGLTTVVIYGPGEHWCFWWEDRSPGNVVALTEAAEPVKAVVQTDSGELTLEGAIRFRPNLPGLNDFINGAAAVAGNAVGLVEAHVVKNVSTPQADGKSRPLRDVLKSIGDINNMLHEEFTKDKTDDVSKFEGRFQVTVGDATISRILPSEEVRKTLSAVTESEVMDEMVAKSFGAASYADLVAKVEAQGPGAPTWAQVNQVRTQKMASSGNLQGMDLKDHTFNLNLSGLDKLTPETAAAFGMALGSFVNRQSQGGGGRSRSQGRAP